MESDQEQTGGRRGRFIVFEGLDGSGKSTQIALLCEGLKRSGRRVYCTAEPTSSATGGIIRDVLSGSYRRGAAELAGLFLADRITHNVDPAWGIERYLDDGVDVICDRYYYSSFAYQGLGADLNWIMDMNLNCPEIAKPDLCVFLDVDHRRCKRRMDRERMHLEIFERDEQVMEQTRLRFYEVFRLLEGREDIRIVDAGRPVDVVAEEILQLVMTLDMP